MRRACPKCGRIEPCAQHPAPAPSNGHRSPWRDRATQHRFRTHILAAAGNQCEYIQDGERCPMTTDLHAHHDKDAPLGGLCLCRAHHKAVDRYAT